MQALEFIELDVPFCSRVYGVAPCTASIPTTGDIKCFNSRNTCQDIANFSAANVTWRFAKPTAYLPADIDIVAPSITEISYTPATISLGKSLGTRATLSVTFKDHPHSDTGEGFDKYLADRDYDPYSQGTFWGKFRARQPFVRGQSLRWISGLVGEALADMEARHFIIDSFDGPTPDGKYTITAKDVLKLADGDRAQAPALSQGFLSGDMTAIATTATLLPSGIGATYPASGLANVGGNEIVGYTRSGDTITLTARGFANTTAVTHKAQDRFQEVLRYQSVDAAVILYNLLVVYSDVPASYIDLAAWQEETATFLGNVYTAIIAEPTSVNTLASEIIEQAALAVWDDNLNQALRLQVLRGVVTDADTFTPENTLQGTLTIKEQPELRLSRVQTYFGQINPTRPLSNLDNYRSTSLIIDEDAEEDYGSASIKTIFSRWIPEAGRAVADRLGAVVLGRYRDPPRRLTFATARHAETDIEIGIGYRVESFCVQDATGAQADIPIQVTRLNPGPDRFSAEAEEMLWSAPAADLTDRQVIFDANNFNLNLRTSHDSIYPTPVSGDVVTCTINAGVLIGTVSTALPAVDVGAWPAGVTLTLIVRGRIQGMGGLGGVGGAYNGLAGMGVVGGPALKTRYAINLELPAGGAIWSGGGGGGGGAGYNFGSFSAGGGGGGGGSGTNPGAGRSGGNGFLPGSGGVTGSGGAATAGGPGGQGGTVNAGAGGAGGGPGLPGTTGNSSSTGTGNSGGAAGAAIDGISYVTTTVSGGDLRGGTIN